MDDQDNELRSGRIIYESTDCVNRGKVTIQEAPPSQVVEDNMSLELSAELGVG